MPWFTDLDPCPLKFLVARLHEELTFFIFHFKIIYPGYNSVYILFYNWPCKNYLQNKELYNTKFTIKIKNNVYDYFSLSLDLKALIEGAIFVSKLRLFQRLFLFISAFVQMANQVSGAKELQIPGGGGG